MGDYFERADERKRDIKRYKVISEHYRDNPGRVAVNHDYITDIMIEVLDLHRNFRIGSDEEISNIMNNFGIRKIVGDEREVRFSFRK